MHKTIRFGDFSPHIALVGPMGAGKSRVGVMLAQNLHIPFVDLDSQIEIRLGQQIAAYFLKHGEENFRDIEEMCLRDILRTQTPHVIACGGGVVLRENNRIRLHERAVSIYLRTTVHVLVERLSAQSERDKRPLLHDGDLHTSIERILADRADLYTQANFTVDTDDHHTSHSVENILATMDTSPAMHACVNVDVGAGYDVLLRETAGAWIADAIKLRHPGRRLAVITDTTVNAHYGDALLTILHDAGFSVTRYIVEPGEVSKQWHIAGDLLDALIAEEWTRDDALIAFGGGVVGDLTGFVASVLLRGIPFFQIPTTTLACVDSSVGGKTGVNSPHGKNLIGSFYQPKGVLIALSYLHTQEKIAHAAGLAEALKIAFTLDENLFLDIEKSAPQLLTYDSASILSVLIRAIALKADIVRNDEREQGRRAILNYGHTIGHAIESGQHFRLLHGVAVALGMVAEAEWAKKQSGGDAPYSALCKALRALDLPIDWRSYDLDLNALNMDKKRSGKTVRMPVVTSLGSCVLQSVALDDVRTFVQQEHGKI